MDELDPRLPPVPLPGHSNSSRAFAPSNLRASSFIGDGNLMKRHIHGWTFRHLASIGVLALVALTLASSTAFGLNQAAYHQYLPVVVKGIGNLYYVSPSGSDGNAGTSETQPWATFNHAWSYLYPGDMLVLLDGVYYQRLNPNKRNGAPGKPITIRAKNDGKAIIDGDTNGDGVPDLPSALQLGDTWSGEAGQNPVGNYFVVEGLVVKNGGASGNDTVNVFGQNNTLRRVSAYNNDTDTNGAVIAVIGGTNNLIEDCVAAGSGRKMIYTFGSNAQNNVFRRCLAAWQEWRGRGQDPGHWPWGDSMEFYHGVNNTIENSIVYGMAPSTGFKAQSQGDVTSGNKILGSMAIGIGMKWNQTPMTWPCPPPPGTLSTTCNNFSGWIGQRNGAQLYGGVSDTLIQDLFAWGNAGVGISAVSGVSSAANNRLIRVTAANNGIGSPPPAEGAGVDAYGLSQFSLVQDSLIEGTQYQGGGARLQYRYINGVLTAEPLWPWPMEDRIRAEFATHLARYQSTNPELANFSVTNTVYPILAQYGAVP